MSIDSEPQAANNKSQCKKSVTGIHNNNNCIQFPNKESTGSLGKFFLYLIEAIEFIFSMDTVFINVYRQNLNHTYIFKCRI